MTHKIFLAIALAVTCSAAEKFRSFGVAGESADYSYEVAWLGNGKRVAGIIIWAKNEKLRSGVVGRVDNGVQSLQINDKIVTEGRVALVEGTKEIEFNEEDSKIIYKMISNYGMATGPTYHKKIQILIDKYRG